MNSTVRTPSEKSSQLQILTIFHENGRMTQRVDTSSQGAEPRAMESYSQTFRHSQRTLYFDNSFRIAVNKCLVFFLLSINVYSNYPLLVLPQYSGGIERQINCSFRFINVYIERRTKFKELSLMNFELMFNKMNLLIGDLEDQCILHMKGVQIIFCQRS